MPDYFVAATRALRRRIGANVRALRLKRKYTLLQLARRSGVNHDTIDRYEMGRGDMPLAHAVRLAHALKITPDRFFAEAGNQPQPQPPQPPRFVPQPPEVSSSSLSSIA